MVIADFVGKKKPILYPENSQGLEEGVYQLWTAVNLARHARERGQVPNQWIDKNGEDMYTAMNPSRTYFALLPLGKHQTLVARVRNEAPVVRDLGPLSIILGEGSWIGRPVGKITALDITQAYPIRAEVSNYHEQDHFGLRRPLDPEAREILDYLQRKK